MARAEVSPSDRSRLSGDLRFWGTIVSGAIIAAVSARLLFMLFEFAGPDAMVIENEP